MTSHPDARFYLEDIHVGLSFATATHTLDEQQIIVFAQQFDPQPFHMDVKDVRESFFGELIASGWHTAALTMRLLVLGGIPLAHGLIGMGGEIMWPNPARPGDILRVEGAVTAIAPSRSQPDRGLVTIHAETKNQRDEVVQNLIARLLVFRKTPL